MTSQHVVQNLSEAAMARMVPKVEWAPLVSLASPRQSDQSCAMPCAGEASTEAEYQARREAVIVSCHTVCRQAWQQLSNILTPSLLQDA